MTEEVETEESGLKALVQYKYVNLSPRIATLSAILAQPNNPGLTRVNLQVHSKLVELMMSAYPNPEFRRMTAKVYQKYMRGQQVTGKPVSQYYAAFHEPNEKEIALKGAKDTLYVWNVVTRALIRAKLLVLKD